MKKQFLNKDFQSSGKGAESFKKENKNFLQYTFCKLTDPKNIQIFSVLAVYEDRFEMAIIDPPYVDPKILIPRTLDDVYFVSGKREDGTVVPVNTKGVLRFETLLDSGFTEEDIEQIKESGFFLKVFQGNSECTLIPESSFLANLCKILKIGKLKEGVNLFRDLYLGSLLKQASPFNLMFRCNDFGAAKAFGVFSEKFRLMPKDFALDIQSQFTDYRIDRWKITHFLTEVTYLCVEPMQYHGMEVRKGIRLTYSDTGDYSTSLESFLLVGDEKLLLNDAYVRKHIGILEAEEIADGFKKQQRKLLESIPDAFGKEVSSLEDSLKKYFKKIAAASLLSLPVKNRILREEPGLYGECKDQKEVLLVLTDILGNKEDELKPETWDAFSREIGKSFLRGKLY